VFFLGRRAATWQPALWGLAAGVMTVASIVGLLKPALDEGSLAAVATGLAAGIAFLVVTRLALSSSRPHIGHFRGADVRTSILVFAVLFVTAFPRVAIGTAYASETAGLGLFVILAIALQNIPEGTSVAIPMADAGFSHRQQFWAAVGTSAPQPVERSSPTRSSKRSAGCWRSRSLSPPVPCLPGHRRAATARHHPRRLARAARPAWRGRSDAGPQRLPGSLMVRQRGGRQPTMAGTRRAGCACSRAPIEDHERR
jgi:ZIP family zinc transporter